MVIEQMEQLRKALPGKSIRAIVVNDGSEYNKTHESLARIEANAKDILLLSYPTNMGKGFAIRTGVQRSLALVIVYTDIDFPYTVESMLKVIKPVVDGEADVTLAVRNDTYYSQLPSGRRWMSKILRSVNRKLLRLHTSDTQGGLKAFHCDVRETFLLTRINRYLFDLEFVYLISRNPKLRIKAVESDLRSGIVMSQMRLKIVARESLNFLKVLVKR